MYISILGRQPALGMAELERIYGSDKTRWFSNESALIEDENFDFEQLGGSMKAGLVTIETRGNWSEVGEKIVSDYSETWSRIGHKITLGISAYGFKATPRDVQRTGIMLKQKLKSRGVSLRLIPNDYAALNTATSHHNKLGLSDNKVELLVVRAGNGDVIVAESVGSQNITALAARDQARPRTDAFVGMLPPKLARIMINLSGITLDHPLTLLDPFCGTGVVLQEAALMGLNIYGTDLSEKMVAYSGENLEWLLRRHRLETVSTFEVGDAMKLAWQKPLDLVVAETYLGQPFSAPPRPEKLAAVRDNCNHIVTDFLKNIGTQLSAGTPLVLAIPAWRDAHGNFTHLPVIGRLDSLGYTPIDLQHVKKSELLYFRETQVVARELLILHKK